MAAPHRAMLPSGGQVGFEDGMQMRNLALELPIVHTRVNGALLRVFISHHRARVGSGHGDRLVADIVIKDAPFPGSYLDDVLIVDRVLVSVGADAPDVKRKQLAV